MGLQLGGLHRNLMRPAKAGDCQQVFQRRTEPNQRDSPSWLGREDQSQPEHDPGPR